MKRLDTKLIKLNESDLTVADATEDIRGRRVVDGKCEEIGQVADLIVDE